jgi:hypothetical protein
MTTGIEHLAQRWKKLNRKLKDSTLATSRVRDIARRAGFEWYVSRGDELLMDFLDNDGRRIFRLIGFGKAKITRLCEILETLPEDDSETEEEAQISPMTLVYETLERWNMPKDFPCALIALPIRVRHYCEENQIATLDALLGEWERLGHSGFKAKKNLGRKSVDELEIFIDSLVTGDSKLASRFLPLEPDGFGADFAASLTHVLLEQSPAVLEILKLRLQYGMTLEESAANYKLTRERVRQVEVKFLAQMSLRLDHFRGLHEEILKAWVELDDWFALVRWKGDSDQGLLAKSALESIFRDSPQGVARELSGEARMEELEDKLGVSPDLWFGGTSLEGFLEGMNADEKEAFCAHLTAGRRFRVDHATGRVHPAITGLRRCIEAMVAEENDPIPLTWIVELIRKTSYHPTLERIDVLRRRSSWLQKDDFPDKMILWRE